MDDSTYSRMVADLYEHIMDAADEVDPDAIEGDVMGGRLDLTAADGSKCILTTQPGPCQIWVAGAGQGVHFGYHEDTGRWLDEKNPERELSAWVTSVVKSISGEELTLSTCGALLLIGVLLVLGAPTTALASCPAGVPILNTLTCNSEINSQVVHTASSQLGGPCSSNQRYSCGAPFAEEQQLGPEGVYEFTCQVSGEVTLLVTNLPCDVDLYVLGDTCDPFADCLFGATNSYAADDSVTFTCAANTTYYIVVEAYGVGHASEASGPCEDSSGALYTPTYTLGFDVSAGTGCPEDCDDGIDNDFNGQSDCDDPACGRSPCAAIWTRTGTSARSAPGPTATTATPASTPAPPTCPTTGSMRTVTGPTRRSPGTTMTTTMTMTTLGMTTTPRMTTTRRVTMTTPGTTTI